MTEEAKNDQKEAWLEILNFLFKWILGVSWVILVLAIIYYASIPDRVGMIILAFFIHTVIIFNIMQRDEEKKLKEKDKIISEIINDHMKDLKIR